MDPTPISYGGYTNHVAYVRTDEAYFLVGWYVNGVWKTTSLGSDSTTEAYFSPDPLSGSISGTTYEIKAVAQPWNEGAENDFDSYTITVYEPITNSGWGSQDNDEVNADVWGYVSIDRHYYSSPSVFAYFSTNAYSNEREFSTLARRRHTIYGDAAKNIHILGGDAHDRSHDVSIGQRLGSLADMTGYRISHSLAGRPQIQYWADTYHRLRVEGINHRFISSDISFEHEEP